MLSPALPGLRVHMVPHDGFRGEGSCSSWLSLVDADSSSCNAPFGTWDKRNGFQPSYWRRPAARPDHQTPSRAKPIKPPMPCVPQHFHPCLAQRQTETDGRGRVWPRHASTHPWHGALSRPFPRKQQSKQARQSRAGWGGEETDDDGNRPGVTLVGQPRKGRETGSVVSGLANGTHACKTCARLRRVGWLDGSWGARWLAGWMASRSQAGFALCLPRLACSLCSQWPFGRPTSHPGASMVGRWCVGGWLNQRRTRDNLAPRPPLHTPAIQAQPIQHGFVIDSRRPSRVRYSSARR